jgi:hypothetical protein
MTNEVSMGDRITIVEDYTKYFPEKQGIFTFYMVKKAEEKDAS